MVNLGHLDEKKSSWVDDSPLTKQSRIDYEREIDLVNNAIREAVENGHTINHQIAYYLNQIKDKLTKFNLQCTVGNTWNRNNGQKHFLVNYLKHIGYTHQSGMNLVRLMKTKTKLMEVE